MVFNHSHPCLKYIRMEELGRQWDKDVAWIRSTIYTLHPLPPFSYFFSAHSAPPIFWGGENAEIVLDEESGYMLGRCMEKEERASP